MIEDFLVEGQLRRWGFNGIGNWSDTTFAQRVRLPFVTQLEPQFPRTARIFRDFPDVYSPDFEVDAAEYSQKLGAFADDPCLLGYFLMNEPKWGFSGLLPAEGMLRHTARCHTRDVLVNCLKARYGHDETALQRAWGSGAVTFGRLQAGRWQGAMPDGASEDLKAFSQQMAERFFGVLSDACRARAPHHLNLGARYYIRPPDWLLPAMARFDVLSVNCYDIRIPESHGEACAILGKPLLVGEWHFGATDRGLPTPGICAVPNQADRARAFRVYLEHAASLPWCVGAHFFQLNDQQFLGRFDGENFNIGLVNVALQPYPDLLAAARQSHERLYAVAAGETLPFADEPAHLPRHFF